MVRSGEEGGGLSDALNSLSTQLERSSNLTKKIKGAMIYPTIVIGVMFIIGILMMIYVMPTITATFIKMGVDLPMTTRILIFVSTFLTEHGLLVLAGAIALVTGVVFLSRTVPGRYAIHFTMIHLPILGTLVKETNSARTARTLSSLLSAGVDVLGAIEITEDVVQNVYFKAVLRGAVKKVEKGSPLSESFIEHSDLYPILVGEMISVGEETGQISKMMSEVAIFYENEIEQKTKDLSTIIEPLLMVVIGAGVGFFALAMIAPIYSISDSIN
jgi:type IV pilus assembly protein PilC